MTHMPSPSACRAMCRYKDDNMVARFCDKLETRSRGGLTSLVFFRVEVALFAVGG